MSSRNGKPQHCFVVKRGNDEHESITLNGVVVASTNHDEDGWTGMDRVRGTVKQIASLIGASYEEAG